MGLLAGFLGGAGQGMADVAKVAIKDNMDTARQERQNAFQTERDTIANDRLTERDKAAAQERRDAMRYSLELHRQLEQEFGKEDYKAAQDALANAGGDKQKAFELAETPGAKKAIEAMIKLGNDSETHKSTLATQAAARAASYSSVDLHNEQLKGAKTTNDRVGLLSGLQDALSVSKAAGNTEAVNFYKDQIASLGEDGKRSKENMVKVTETEDPITGEPIIKRESYETKGTDKTSKGEKLRSEAADAVARGANKDKVNARLKELGLQPL